MGLDLYKGGPLFLVKTNIIIMGFMGTGKSATGRLVAKRLERVLVDMDAEIERREGRKIGDIFSHRGITHLHKGKDDAALFEHLVRLSLEAEPGSLTFANFVEFDSLYGHRRDVSGYARALEWFDTCAGAFLSRLQPGDLALFTADHGNDPTWHGTEHTRERVPVLISGRGAGQIGLCAFADVGASVAAHLGIPAQGPGRSFL